MITAQVMAELRDNPVMFVREILNAEPDAWQAEALNALSKESRVAIRSGHGVGKSCMESWAVCWFLFTRYFPKVIATAPTIRQLYDILWAEISKWLKRSPLLSELFEWQKTKVVMKAEPERWFAVARTAAKPENMQGFHEHSILFVLDEASGISDEIFEAVEGALTTPDAKLLICGNPTRNSGFFKRAFFEDRESYHVQKVSSAACWVCFIFGSVLMTANMLIRPMFPAIMQSPINSGAIAMLAGLLIVPIISAITPAPDKKLVDEAFKCYDEKVVVPLSTALNSEK